jgi:FixJ family two-component response regulator
MPGMTGIQLAETLVRQGTTMPILFVTGAELDEREHAQVMELGVGLLKKPFDMQDLVRIVHSKSKS